MIIEDKAGPGVGIRDEVEACFDAGTIGHLTALGVGPAWECLEVGAGGGWIAEWLCERVGPAGRVTAVDTDVARLRALDYPNLQITEIDPFEGDLGRIRYDLVHARLLFARTQNPHDLLKRMIAAVRKNGWVLVEDLDFNAFTALPASRAPVVPRRDAALFRRVTRAVERLYAMGGRDLGFGRLLPESLLAAGLVEVGAQSVSSLVRGGTSEASYSRTMMERLGDRAVDAGLIEARDIERALKRVEDPDCYWMQAPLVSAWGRRPS